MIKTEVLNKIFKLLGNHQLSGAIGLLENYLLMHRPGDMDRLSEIVSDYKLMTDYWKQGYDDPMRTTLYRNLMHRVYMLTARMEIDERVKASAFLKSIQTQAWAYSSDWSATTVKERLENYVSETALLQLEPEHVREQHAESIYEGHYTLLLHLFNIIVTTGPWSDGEAKTYEQMLLSPTVDAADQCLMVSAMMLACQQVFDYNKWCVMLNVYRQADDEQLRQRALVGWALSVDNDMQTVYPDMQGKVKEACDDEEVANELTELQMQLYYCMDAEKDQQVITKEIIPDIMEGNNLRVTPKGLVETEEDSLEEILHPDVSERKMEKLEQSVQRMANMQKQGADIYFGGFSQMKRFPFFNVLANWFTPYSPQHPAVSQILKNARGKKFLNIITHYGAFCDSDKFSFVLAYQDVLKFLPKEVLKMIDEGEAVPVPVAGELDAEEQKGAAFIRRIYLQNIYRFYRIFSMRSEFCDLFDKKDRRYLFFSHSIFNGTGLAKHFLAMAGFLLKRKLKVEAHKMVSNRDLPMDFAYFMTIGALNDNMVLKEMAYEGALKFEPDNEKALAGLARVLFAKGNYEKAEELFRQLLEKNPDYRGYELSLAVCLLKTGKYEEAAKMLYKLNYEQPDDLGVSRVLAWAQVLTGKAEAAMKFYKTITADEEHCEAEDFLNSGLCLWLNRDISGALDMLRHYYEKSNDQETLKKEILETEQPLLEGHGITETEQLLMLDQIIGTD